MNATPVIEGKRREQRTKADWWKLFYRITAIIYGYRKLTDTKKWIYVQKLLPTGNTIILCCKLVTTVLYILTWNAKLWRRGAEPQLGVRTCSRAETLKKRTKELQILTKRPMSKNATCGCRRSHVLHPLGFCVTLNPVQKRNLCLKTSTHRKYYTAM